MPRQHPYADICNPSPLVAATVGVFNLIAKHDGQLFRTDVVQATSRAPWALFVDQALDGLVAANHVAVAFRRGYVVMEGRVA